MPKRPIDKIDQTKPLNFIEMVQLGAQFRKERAALFNLERRRKKFEEGHNWDEDTEHILVGGRDEMALQRQTLTQEIWKTVVAGNVEEFRQILLEKPKEVGTKRGVFGETMLHICLLFSQNGSPTHREIAKMLVRQCPFLLDAEYNREPYLGEAPLHMAIINQDLDLVSFLLSHGANLQAQARGTFFRPSGKVYYGEYPLSFAACIQNEQMVEALLKAGADVAAQDTCLGNTVLHLMVIHEFPHMYDLLLRLSFDIAKGRFKKDDRPSKAHLFEEQSKLLLDPSPSVEESFRSDTKEGVLAVDYSENFKKGMIALDRIPNAFKRTPFTLAAELGKLNIFTHLINNKKEILWSYGAIRAVAYPLDEIDTFPDPARYGKRGALELIVTQTDHQRTFGYETSERLRLLDVTPMNQLLQEKWGRFARQWFYAWCVVYFLYLMVFNVAVLTQRGSRHRLILEYIVFAGALFIILMEALDVIRLRSAYFKDRSVRLFSFLSWSYCICIILTAIFRYTLPDPKADHAEAIVLSIASVCAWVYLLFFARGFKTVGYLVVMIREMVFTDIVRFLLVYIVFLFGFSVGYTILFQGTNVTFQNFGASLFSLYQYFMADFPTLDDYPKASSEGMVHALHVGYTAAVTILMLNLLIAMLNSTFNQVRTKARLQWKVEWASIILMIERRMPEFLRKNHRSGKCGRDLGFDNDTYYIILEERTQENHDITRPGQTPHPKKLSVFVKDMLKVQRAKNPKEARLQRTWAWPSVQLSPKKDLPEADAGMELAETSTNPPPLS